MPYIYSKVDDLQNTAKVGIKECVVLVQYYAKAPVTSLWKQGVIVVGGKHIAKGTAIATFVNGKYPNVAHGNHAALYISQDVGGISVMDQWTNDVTKPKVSKRYIKKKERTKMDPS